MIARIAIFVALVSSGCGQAPASDAQDPADTEAPDVSWIFRGRTYKNLQDATLSTSPSARTLSLACDGASGAAIGCTLARYDGTSDALVIDRLTADPAIDAHFCTPGSHFQAPWGTVRFKRAGDPSAVFDDRWSYVCKGEQLNLAPVAASLGDDDHLGRE